MEAIQSLMNNHALRSFSVVETERETMENKMTDQEKIIIAKYLDNKIFDEFKQLPIFFQNGDDVRTVIDEKENNESNEQYLERSFNNLKNVLIETYDTIYDIFDLHIQMHSVLTSKSDTK